MRSWGVRDSEIIEIDLWKSAPSPTIPSNSGAFVAGDEVPFAAGQGWGGYASPISHAAHT
jgi:hypothetical protein